ncbi:hypothetical protein H8957_002224 [Semnopithecus entellus]
MVHLLPGRTETLLMGPSAPINLLCQNQEALDELSRHHLVKPVLERTRRILAQNQVTPAGSLAQGALNNHQTPSARRHLKDEGSSPKVRISSGTHPGHSHPADRRPSGVQIRVLQEGALAGAKPSEEQHSPQGLGKRQVALGASNARSRGRAAKVAEPCFPSSRGTKPSRKVASRTGGLTSARGRLSTAAAEGAVHPPVSFPRTRESQGAHSSKGDEALHQGPGLISLAAFPGASVFPYGESGEDHAPCCGLTRRPGVEWRRRPDRRRGKYQDVCRFRAMGCGGLRWCAIACDGEGRRKTEATRLGSYTGFAPAEIQMRARTAA